MFSTRGSIGITGVLILSLVMGCAKEKDWGEPPEKPVVTYQLSGLVIDANGIGISGATVTFVSDTKNGSTTTDGSGTYVFSNMSIGNYTIDASKSGYTNGATSAVISDGGAVVSEITIKTLSTIETRVEQTVTVAETKLTGVSVKTETTENVSTGGTATVSTTREVSATITPGTDIIINNQVVTESIQVSVTPVMANEIPSAPKTEMSVGSVIFEPQNAKFSQPVEIKLPCGIKLPANSEVSLKKYENGTWTEIGTAKVDESGLNTTSSVTEFGQMSIQPEITSTVESSAPVVTPVSETLVEQTATSVTVQSENTIEFPGGLPEGVSTEYALSLIMSMTGINLGTTSVTIDISSAAAQKIAMPASPLAPQAGSGIWVKVSKLVKQIIVKDNQLIVTIQLKNGTYTITIPYKTSESVWSVIYEWIWREHNQGTI